MHLLNEVTHSPNVTQRELSKRIGVALGLTNLMLRRLAKKGCIKIINTQRNRISYLITPKGILEKSRLTYEFVQYSLHLYSTVRTFLREQLSLVAKGGHRRILLCGTNELAEIAFLTIQEMGLELVGVVDEEPDRPHFLGSPVKRLADVDPAAYDRLIYASLWWEEERAQRLATLGIPAERIIILPPPSFPHPATSPVLPLDTGAVQPVTVEAAAAAELQETA